MPILAKRSGDFNDGTVINLDIPLIIEHDLWKRIQDRLDRNKTLSPRNAKGVYLLQGLIKCGDCDHYLSVSRLRGYSGGYAYRCHIAGHYPNEPHPKPYNHNGAKLDWAVWRKIVDSGLKIPAIVREQIEARVCDLQSRGDEVHNEITFIQQRLTGIDNERSFYQKKAAQGKITEDEFDRRMDETSEQIKNTGMMNLSG